MANAKPHHEHPLAQVGPVHRSVPLPGSGSGLPGATPAKAAGLGTNAWRRGCAYAASVVDRDTAGAISWARERAAGFPLLDKRKKPTDSPLGTRQESTCPPPLQCPSARQLRARIDL